MKNKVLIIGGYGDVGRIIAARLSKRFPGKVIVAGRNYQKAKALSLKLKQRVIPLALDISLVSARYGLLDDVGTVIMCVDQKNIEFIRRCLQRGINYIDISPDYHVISGIEMLNKQAKKAGATAVLSVGLAPGLTNLLTKLCQTKLSNMTYADIYLNFGLGDIPGEAALQWLIKNYYTEFTILEDGVTKQVKSFVEGKQTIFPGKTGKRTAYRFNFAEQHVIPQTLGLRRVSSWLCFDSAVMTCLFSLIKKMGLHRLLMVKSIKRIFIDILNKLHIGSEVFVIKVEAGSLPENGILYECWVRGENEALITALVTVKVAEKLVSSSFPSGVFHIEQLFDPLDFLESLGNHGIRFEEKEYTDQKKERIDN